MKNSQCTCCGSKSIKKLAPYGKYDHYKCEDCGYEHFYTSVSEAVAKLYENDSDYEDDLNVAKTYRDYILWHHAIAIKFLKDRFKTKRPSVLDVGCFNGFFVKELLSLGFDAHGIDFNKKAVSYGQVNFGLASSISTTTVESIIARGDRFDVITLFEVLKHLPEVQPFLVNIMKLLKEDGIIIISTPNNNMCWRPPLDSPPHHLSRFTIRSLNACLAEFNMEILHSAEQMSTYELVRHFMGVFFFRAKDRNSLRGGKFGYKKLSTSLRRTLNSLRKISNVFLAPFDKIFYKLGFRYISQILICRKMK